jgi:hypothetical protein
MTLPTEPWPFGNPTSPCPGCKGTGANASAISRHQASGKQQTTREDLAKLRCGECLGRGRVIRAVKDTYRCKHGRPCLECPNCRKKTSAELGIKPPLPVTS